MIRNVKMTIMAVTKSSYRHLTLNTDMLKEEVKCVGNQLFYLY